MQTHELTIEQALLSAINVIPGIELVILFGSLAKGSAHAQSDLDIAVDATRPLTADEKMLLIGAIATVTGRPIDLVDLQVVGEPLLGQILKHGQRIFDSNNRYARLLSKHLFDQADFLPYQRRILAERRQAWIAR
jgi:predicted nucleotidyltransferase